LGRFPDCAALHPGYRSLVELRYSNRPWSAKIALKPIR
jgi:hypothetical protein